MDNNVTTSEKITKWLLIGISVLFLAVMLLLPLLHAQRHVKKQFFFPERAIIHTKSKQQIHTDNTIHSTNPYIYVINKIIKIPTSSKYKNNDIHL